MLYISLWKVKAIDKAILNKKSKQIIGGKILTLIVKRKITTKSPTKFLHTNKPKQKNKKTGHLIANEEHIHNLSMNWIYLIRTELNQISHKITTMMKE